MIMEANFEKNYSADNHQLTITDGMKSDLLSAVKWIKFLTIVSCCAMGLLVILGLVMLFVGEITNTIIGIVYLIIVVVYIPVLKKAFAFIQQSRNACNNDDNQQLAEMFSSVKYIAKYIGVLNIVAIACYALALIISVAGIGLAALAC